MQTANLNQSTTAVSEALLIAGLRQHELAEEAQKLNTLLKREAAERTLVEAALRQALQEVRTAHKAAERASRAKDDFLAALSHELRTPLTPVLMAAATLQEDMSLPAPVRGELAMMERNITLEARLIDDLLDLTKLSHGKLSLRAEACDAHDLIGHAIEIVREDARVKDIAIDAALAAPNSRLLADPVRFQQVIWNLLRNAIKFTPVGGRVGIRTREMKTVDGASRLRIEVTDSGIGIDPGKLEQIFQRFDQGGLTGAHRFGGLGLGLAIARAVLDLHGGWIIAQSAGAGLGATFVVELPAAAAGIHAVALAGPPGRQAAAPKAGALRLLVVEDHESTRRTMAMLLERDGHHVVTGASIREALVAAATEKFDLVISDLGLPDGSGNELMQTLSATYGLRGIALSGYGAEEDLLVSRSAGFVSHLVKPVSIADLRRIVGAILPVGP